GVNVSGTFFFEEARMTPAGGTPLTVLRIGAVNVTVGSGEPVDPADGGGSFSGLTNGEGLIVVVRRPGLTQVAGKFSGKVELPGAELPDIGVEFNNAEFAVTESIRVNDTTLDLNLEAGSYFRFKLLNVSFNFGGLLEIRGDFAAGSDTFSGTGLEIFVGRGPSQNEDGTPNPAAMGVLITNA